MNRPYSFYLLVGTLVGLLIVCGLFLAPADTIQAQSGGSPRIVASYQHNNISFEGFTPNTNLHFEIFSSPGGVLLEAKTLATDSSGNARWSAWDTFDLDPGQHIVATDGVTPRQLTVALARYDVLDLGADQARGIAPAGAQVEVQVHGLTSYNELSTVTGSAGAWTVDFGADGQDIQNYYSTKAYIFDADGDVTIAWEPTLQVQNLYDSYVSGQSFTSGGTLTVEIYETLNGTLLYRATDIVAGSDRGDFGVPMWEHGQNLQPGTHVVVTDQTSGEAREVTLQPFTLDLFDYDQELVAGTAPAGLAIRVAAHTGSGYYEVVAAALSDGSWSADFTTVGADLNPSDDLYALLHDLDSDTVRTVLLGPMASITEDFVHWSWHGAPLTATIFDADGNIVFGPQVYSQPDDMGIDAPDYGIDLEPGYRVEVDYGGGRIISLTLADLSVTSVDRVADWAEGTAPPGSTVTVLVWDMCWPYFAGFAIRTRMDVQVGGTGLWQADFGAQGFDITWQHSVAVFLQEFDGGVSAAAETRHRFDIVANPTYQQILLRDLIPGSTVTLRVFESEGGPLVDVDTLTADPFGNAQWGALGSDKYVSAGYFIEATDNATGWVETLTVADGSYHAVDVANDIAQGHAPPGAEVEVIFHRPGTNQVPYVDERLWLTAGDDGSWLADFGAAGIDIPPYASHSLQIYECDGDVTIDRLPYIYVSVDDWIRILSFTPDSDVTVEIYDGPNGSLLFGPYTLRTDLAGGAFLSAGAHGVDLQPGYYTVVTDLATGFAKTHQMEFVFLQVDVVADVAYGLASPGARALARYQRASIVNAYADGSGHWTADFGAIGVDLTDEILNEFWNTEVWVFDEDEDRTWDRWPDPGQAPSIEAILGPDGPVAVNTEIQVSALFSDPDEGDTHTAVWDWDDGTSSPGTVDEQTGTVTGSHTYSEPGVYSLSLTVADDDGSAMATTLIVVYDPAGDFVTGGGWINSPEGAYTLDPLLAGKANFGFVAKYKKGADTPSGNTEFQFHVAGLNFHSDSYHWLVVAGHKAMFKGVGTVNGAGNYGFLISAIDADLTPSTDVDLFRIKIWDKDNGDAVLYDNLMDADEDADPTTAIGGGNIVIHRR